MHAGPVVLMTWLLAVAPAVATGAPPADPTAGEPGGARPAARARPEQTKRAAEMRVQVNGVTLGNDEIAALQQRYGLRFVPGDFWYDRRSGAWGVVGGATAGIVAPGIPFRGELRRDASRGDTGVVVNERELPIEEVLALQQIVPVFQGRYWIDSQGYFGLEGGPPIGNLAAAAQARQVPRQGILSTWDRTGVAVFGY